MSITFEQIKEKLGFDPLNPPKRPSNGDELAVIDNIPSPYSVLTAEESHWLCSFVYEKLYGKKISL